MQQLQSLTEGSYFHLYNRGINGENIFREQRNYVYFLNQYFYYCKDVLETYAYALLKNHFHLLVYVKENAVVPRYKGKGDITLNASKQLSHFFNSYAQSVNKAYKRTGPLFESPFERKLVDDEHYITSLTFFFYYNPQMHGFVSDFRSWEFSSFHSIMQNDHQYLPSQKILSWFGGKEQFIKLHEARYMKQDVNKFLLDG